MLLLASITTVHQSRAGGMPVVDIPKFSLDMIKFGKEYAHWAKQIQDTMREWNQKIKEYQEAMTKLNAIMNNPGNMMASYTTDMKIIPEDHGDEIHCAWAGSERPELSISYLFNAIGLNPGGNVLKQQHALCLQANHLRNKKYNEMVTMVNEAKKRHEAINKHLATAKSDNTEGAWRSAMVSSQAIMASSLVDIQFAEARLKAYDEMIAKVERDSDGLAKKAMNGNNSILGTVVSTAVLAKALQEIRD